jgi:cytochrome c5
MQRVARDWLVAGVAGGVLAVATAPSAAAPSADGPSVYKAVCMRCHGTGEYGAPKLGDRAAWEQRVRYGIDDLLDHVIEGRGAMPPRGGKDDLSDAELRAAVVYMLRETGLDAQ